MTASQSSPSSTHSSAATGRSLVSTSLPSDAASVFFGGLPVFLPFNLAFAGAVDPGTAPVLLPAAISSAPAAPSPYCRHSTQCQHKGTQTAAG